MKTLAEIQNYFNTIEDFGVFNIKEGRKTVCKITKYKDKKTNIVSYTVSYFGLCAHYTELTDAYKKVLFAMQIHEETIEMLLMPNL